MVNKRVTNQKKKCSCTHVVPLSIVKNLVEKAISKKIMDHSIAELLVKSIWFAGPQYEEAVARSEERIAGAHADLKVEVNINNCDNAIYGDNCYCCIG